MAQPKRRNRPKTIKVLTQQRSGARSARDISPEPAAIREALSDSNSPDEKPVSSVTVSRWENAILRSGLEERR